MPPDEQPDAPHPEGGAGNTLLGPLQGAANGSRGGMSGLRIAKGHDRDRGDFSPLVLRPPHGDPAPGIQSLCPVQAFNPSIREKVLERTPYAALNTMTRNQLQIQSSLLAQDDRQATSANSSPKAIKRADDSQVGPWSAEVSVVVGG